MIKIYRGKDIPSGVLDKILRLRLLCWSSKTSGDASNNTQFLEALDGEAVHVVIYTDGELVAAARLSSHKKDDLYPYRDVISEHATQESWFWLMSRLVVHPQHRRMGHAKALDHQRLLYVASKSNDSVFVVTSVSYRTASLETAGFERCNSSKVNTEQKIGCLSIPNNMVDVLRCTDPQSAIISKPST